MMPRSDSRAGNGSDSRSRAGVLVRRLAALLLAALAPMAALAAPDREDILFGRVYASRDPSIQKMDLYLPDPGDKPAPVLIYVQGGFWGALDDRFRQAARSSTRLVLDGVAVAIVGYRSPRQAPWPAALEDLAAAVAFLKREAPRHGLDPGRIYLAGHSSGGYVASRLAFAGDILKQAGLTPGDIAGVITLGGMHDPMGHGTVGRVRDMVREAFGATFPAASSPPPGMGETMPAFLILSAERDLEGFARDAQDFARKLHRSNTRVTYQIVPNSNHAGLGDLGAFKHTFSRELVLDFMGVRPMDEKIAMLIKVDNRIFFDPPFSTESFWERHKERVRAYPVDDLFLRALHAHILESRYQLSALPLKTYHAIPVAELVGTLPGEGGYLVTRNVRNERYHWPLREMLQYDPVIVVGIDHERNLFHYGIPYQTRREHSWIDPPGPLPLVFRALGGLVHFRKPPPEALRLRFSADMSLTADGFALAATDPLTLAGATIPEVLRPVVTYANGCYSCHTLRGVGSAAHHTRYDTGASQGGYALPLEDYPPDVWKRFVFHQTTAAGMIGVTPNLIAEAAQQPLYEVVEKARAERDRARPAAGTK